MNILDKYNERLKGPSRTRILVSIGLAILVLLSFFGGFFTHMAIRGKNVQVVSEVVEIMDKVGYVYDPEIDDYVKLEGDKVARLIAGNFLDGYSKYYTKEEYEQILQENTGKYVGIGISFSASEEVNSNQILKVSINSPAFYAGMLKGDLIKEIRVSDKDNLSAEYTKIENGVQLSNFLKGVEENQTIDLKIQRGETLLEPISLKKEVYYMSYVTYQDDDEFTYFAAEQDSRINSVEDAYKTIDKLKDEQGNLIGGDSALSSKTALITLSAFEGDAGYQMGAIIKYMVENQKENMILNLCGNGGGDMTVLTEIASYLICNRVGNDNKGNYKIVIANEKLDSKDGETDESYRTSNFSVKKNNFNDGIKKITVLADRNTASASECLIGAMIDYQESSNGTFSKDNLVIVGSQKSGEEQMVYRTYGKGIMQTTYRLQSGGALKLTTAKILWPKSETCIHKAGITPSKIENGCNTFELALQRANAILSAS